MLSFDQLGLAEAPRTSSMKVQKTKLAEVVRDYLREQESFEETDTDSAEHFSKVSTRESGRPSSKSSNESVEESYKTSSKGSVKNQALMAYYKATGMPIDKLDINVNAAQFADSIALMRVRDYLRKSLGQTLTIKEMTENPTLKSQIDLLEQRHVSTKSHHQPKEKPATDTVHTPSLEELEILFGSQEAAQSMKLKMIGTLELRGLNWTNVSSVIPASDFMQALLESHVIDTWNFAIAVTTKCGDVSVSPPDPRLRSSTNIFL
jgi:hypothetical protein